jgi:hypothetical protein
MKRWMGAALAALAASAGFAASGPASASSSAWYRVYQASTAGTFSDIAAVSNTNIWAVGEPWDSKGRFTFRPLIRHYAGHGWQTVTLPGSPRFESELVSASAANDVWVFGLTRSSVATSVAYRYDGSRWHKIPMPAQTYVQGAVAFGPRNVWAFGSSATIFAPGSHVSANLFHWNGSRWRGYNLAHGNFVGESMSASGPKNLWVAGFVPTGKAQQAAAYRWNGSGWHVARIPRVLTDNPAVSAFSAANVWIGWETAARTYITRWSGHRWYTMATPGNADTLNIVADGAGGYWFGDNSILTGNTWTTEPPIGLSGAYGPVVSIPGTTSVIEATSVENPGSSIQRPTLYRFDL